MAIYFKFKSAKDYDSVPVDDPFTSVAAFKQKVYRLKYKGKNNSGLCFGNDYDIVVMNAQTNDCYDDNMLIPVNTRVLIKRVPGTRRHIAINTAAIVVPGSQTPKSSVSNSSNTTKSGSRSATVTASSSNDISVCSSSSDGMKGMSSKKLNFPVELVCPLCENPMKCAMFTAKCCFSSFCDRCIRDHLIRSNFKCVCGATDVLADYLIPNITVRSLINSILERGFTIPESCRLVSSSQSANVQLTMPRVSAESRGVVAVDVETSAHLQTSKSANVELALPRAAANEEMVLYDELGNKKRKIASFEDVGTESRTMRSGCYPCNSSGVSQDAMKWLDASF